MHDFHTADPAEMRTSLMKKAANRLKNTEGGRRYMCDIMNEAFARVRAEAKDDDRREFALNMIRKGKYSDEEISDLTSLSLGDINDLRDSLKPAV